MFNMTTTGVQVKFCQPIQSYQILLTNDTGIKFQGFFVFRTAEGVLWTEWSCGGQLLTHNFKYANLFSINATHTHYGIT